MVGASGDVAVEVNPDVFVVVVVISEVIVAISRSSQIPYSSTVVDGIDFESVDASEGVSALVIC